MCVCTEHFSVIDIITKETNAIKCCWNMIYNVYISDVIKELVPHNQYGTSHGVCISYYGIFYI